MGIKTYADLYYIFSGGGPPNPHDLRHCSARHYCAKPAGCVSRCGKYALCGVPHIVGLVADVAPPVAVSSEIMPLGGRHYCCATDHSTPLPPPGASRTDHCDNTVDIGVLASRPGLL